MDGQPSLRRHLLSPKLQLLWKNHKSSSSSWDHLCGRKRSRAQAAQKASPHALPMAHLGSAGPSCLWQQHYRSSSLSPSQPPWWHHCLQLHSGDRPLALPGYCCSGSSPPQTLQPPAGSNGGRTAGQSRGTAAPELLGTGCTVHPSVACSQPG